MTGTIRREACCRQLVWIAALWVPLMPANASTAAFAQSADSTRWGCEATLNRFPRSVHGSFGISGEGVDFRPAKGQPIHWVFEDILTVDLQSPRKLSFVTYENRRWHVPGDRPFEFTLKQPMPPEVASELIRFVGKPAVNGIPFPRGSGLETIGARHRTTTGGSTGVLRFREGGIDYLAQRGDDSRSWRWADIQTLAHPDPYRFRIGGYFETFDFELKQPLPDDVFDRLWDRLYAQGLNTLKQGGSAHAESH
jgi:hypothetical protein